MDFNYRIKLRIGSSIYIKWMCNVSNVCKDLEKKNRLKYLCLHVLLKKKKKGLKKSVYYFFGLF